MGLAGEEVVEIRLERGAGEPSIVTINFPDDTGLGCDLCHVILEFGLRIQRAIKYSTAIPVISISALKYHVLHEFWTAYLRPAWLLSSVINSTYSFYWDLKRDWDLSVFTRIFKFKNPHICTNILHGRRWVFYWVIGSNLILRCTWTYKLSAHLRHNYMTVFTITALEIVRRFQWIFFRVENEWNKMTVAKPSIELSADENPKEDERLLGAGSHNI